MIQQTPLSKKATDRADADGLPADHPLRTVMAEFDEAADGYFAEPKTVPVNIFMSRWARARRAWSEYSGEPLV